jgi:hypothetical protein
VQVVTTPAPEQDVGVVDTIRAALAEQRMTPAEHLLDSGYVTPENGVPGVDRSRDHHCRADMPGSARCRAARLRQGGRPRRLAGRDRNVSARDGKPTVETHDGGRQAATVGAVPASGLPRLHDPAAMHRKR